METAWTSFTIYYGYYQPVFAFIVGIMAVTGTYIGWSSFLPIWRGMMIRKARREHVKVFLTDKFVSDIEDAVLSGEMSREEASEAYRDLKKCFPIPNLFPATELLKENINKRLSSFTHAPVDLPPIRRKKHMFEKAT